MIKEIVIEEIVKPPKLQIGQTIGVVAPASPPRISDDIESWLEQICRLGFQVKTGAHLYDRHGFLAGADLDRAADVNAMFADAAVDAIISLRNGHGSARILPYLDYELIRTHPNISL